MGNENRGNHAGIEAVAIDGDDATAARCDLIDDRLHAMFADRGGAKQRHAPGAGIGKIISPRAANAALSYLDDPLYPGHFAGSAHGARECMHQTGALVTPVEMCIDLQNGDRTKSFVAGEERNGGGVISTEEQRHGAGPQNTRGCGGDQRSIFHRRHWIGRKIAKINRP